MATLSHDFLVDIFAIGSLCHLKCGKRSVSHLLLAVLNLLGLRRIKEVGVFLFRDVLWVLICLFLGLLSLTNFFNELVFLFFLKVGLLLNCLHILLCLLLDLFLLRLKFLFKLRHLLFILNLDNFFNDISHNAFLSIERAYVSALIQKGQLFLQFGNFILIFSQ